MIVTTFSPKGYKDYGKRFIDSYREHCDIPLTVYVEDDLDIEGVTVKNLFDVPGCSRFLEVIGDFDPSAYTGANIYRYDANKFCRKVFAITDTGLSYSGKFMFLGADTVFLRKTPDDIIEALLDGHYLSYLGRRWFHSETDFLAFDTEHRDNKLFMSLFLREYTTGAYKGLKYYCDSDVFDHLRVLLGVSANNINVLNDERHPFVKSVLGKYMDHLKGPTRKQAGRSSAKDYTQLEVYQC